MAKKSGNKVKFKIANPQEQLDKIKIDKYKIGEKGLSFYDIREMKPIFAFDYLSLNTTELCFNCESLKMEDYLGFITALKTNSQFTYNELRTNKY